MFPQPLVGVPFVADYPLWPQLWAASPFALDCSLAQEGFKDRRLVLLARSQHEGHRLTLPLRPQVYLGG